MIEGIDVSHWQGLINWNMVSESGEQYAFIKRTEGYTFLDPRSEFNYLSAVDSNMLVGLYHFFRPTVSVNSQTQWFVNNVLNLPGNPMLVLDLEVHDGASPGTIQTRARQWLQLVESLLGRRPIIYTGPYFTDRYLQNASWLSDYPLWIANYGVQSPTVPRPWGDWTFWQYTSSGSVPGVDGRVDRNFFNGTLQELKDFADQEEEEDCEDLRQEVELLREQNEYLNNQVNQIRDIVNNE